MALMAIIMGLGLLFYILLGFRKGGRVKDSGLGLRIVAVKRPRITHSLMGATYHLERELTFTEPKLRYMYAL